MMVAEIRMYELLKSQFGEKDAKIFVQLFQESLDHAVELKKSDIATKKDIAILKAEAIAHRADLLRTVYLTSVAQLVAIAASVVTLIILLKK